MTERIVRFGPENGLLGILTEPAGRPRGPAVLLLNPGLLHHVGPFSWYVALARRLAASGILSLRFDISGLGDSPLRNDNGTPVDRAVRDMTAALDQLERKYQARQVVAIGLCSGGLLAHLIAVSDPRIVGTVQFDGIGYTTPGFFLRHYSARALKMSAWLNAGRRFLNKMIPTTEHPELPLIPAAEGFIFDFPPKDLARDQLIRLLDRGVRLQFLYTGELAYQYFNHLCQFEEMFGKLPHAPDQLEVDYNDDADHLYADHDQRQTMFARVESWLTKFPT